MFIGEKIAGRYEIVSKIGAGGMGIVFKARDHKENRIVAVKILKESLTSEKHTKRFNREFRVLANMDHQNIVSVSDYGTHGGSNFFVMEFIDGKNFGKLCSTYPNGIMDFETLINYVSQICYALSHIHANGVIHRDLKPGNIMITDDKKAILMDFGLVKSNEFSATLTMEDEIVGTISYMSPEQAQGLTVNYNADLYSLGVILYQATTGRRPFLGNSPISIIYKHINETPEKPCKINPNIPSRLEEIILQLLEKDQTKRYQFAEEVNWDIISLSQSSETVTLDYKRGVESSQKLLLTSPTVGRIKILSKIRLLIDNLSKNKSNTICISGDPGIGKSRILNEIAAYCRIKDIPMLRGFCSEDNPLPYAPFIQIIKSIFQEKSEYILSHLSAIQAQAIINLVPELTTNPAFKSRNIQPSDDPTSAGLKKIILYEAVFKLFTLYLDEKPFLFSIDDLHWIDVASLELIQFFQDKKEEYSFLFVEAHRSEELSESEEIREILKDLATSTNAFTLHLEPLDEENIKMMIKYILAKGEISPGVVELLKDKSGGNPLFIEQILKDYIEESVIYREAGKWQTMRDTEELSIPGNIQQIVLRRFTNLDETQREVISYAAIIGNRFDFDLLKTITEQDEENLLDILDEMVRLKIIQEIEIFGEDMYAFGQNFIREVLYEVVTVEERKTLHNQIAKILEKRMENEENGDNFYEPLAYHYFRGDNPKQALKYFFLAGKRAKNIYANSKAQNNFDKALQMLETVGKENLDNYHTRKAEIFLESGRLAFFLGKNEAALEYFQTALKNASDGDQKELTGEIFRNIGSCYRAQGELDYAYKNYEKALKIGEEIGDENLQCHSLNGMGAVHYQRSEFDKTIQINEQIMDVYKQADDKEGVAMTLNNIGAICYRKGEYDETLRCFQKAYMLYNRIGIKQKAHRALRNCAAVMTKKGDYNSALNTFEKVLSYQKEIGDKKGIGDTYLQMGNARWHLGEYSAALQYYEESLAIQQSIEDRSGIALNLNNIGEVHRVLGHYDKSLEHKQKALAIMETLGDQCGIALTCNTIGITYQQMYSLDMAIIYHEKARSISEKNNCYNSLFTAKIHLGVDYSLLGKYEKAEEHFMQALETIGDNVEEKIEVIVKTCEMYIDNNEIDKAYNYYDELQMMLINNFKKVIMIQDLYLSGRLNNDEKVFLEAIEKVKEMGAKPLLWKFYYHLGNIYEKKKDSERAIRSYYRAIHVIKENIIRNIPIQNRKNFWDYKIVKDLQDKVGDDIF
jgi:serine/threonine protein kinase/tetratricopeptide (TPR) repeat protein